MDSECELPRTVVERLVWNVRPGDRSRLFSTVIGQLFVHDASALGFNIHHATVPYSSAIEGTYHDRSTRMLQKSESYSITGGKGITCISQRKQQALGNPLRYIQRWVQMNVKLKHSTLKHSDIYAP